MRNRLSLLPAVWCLLMLVTCSGSTPSNPKSAVIAMFGAMERDDKAALAHLLDLPALLRDQGEGEDYALQTDSPRVFINPEHILEDLTEEGQTKRRWFSLQRIIDKAEVIGETATVGVTFVDKQQSKAYLTKFGLHIVNGKWKIYSFKTTQSSS